ncbi:hypothetical protein AO498_04387 [Algoriphagus sanaruensis]|uniref:Uncharacterized protein n=1 Tax=Algoriphagus sanaruensis TaxID=1727163 RepID=A0A142EKH7_9BACT|nr:hypothetical protein AO498_04387 [Algoriphagus sanaruensis]
MDTLETLGYLLFVSVQLAFIAGIFWLVFYYSWKTFKDFRKSKK